MVASSLAATALLAVAGMASAKTYELDTAAHILSSASTLAHDGMALYKGNLTGHTPGMLTELDDPTEDSTYWWHGAAFLTAYVEYFRRTGDDTYNANVAQGLITQAGPLFDYKPLHTNSLKGNDDQCLWAVGALLASESGLESAGEGKPSWLRIAQNVFDMQAALFDYESKDLNYYTCGGGIRTDWNTSGNFYYKDTLTNGCFLNLGARLAKLTGNETYAKYADKTWEWLWSVNLIDHATYAVAHGSATTHNCDAPSIAKQQYSGSAALITEGAALMYNFSSTSTVWKERTQKLVDATLGFFFPDGVAREITIATESCESGLINCDSNVVPLKGILHRSLASATQLAPFVAGKADPILRKSAEAAVKQCTGDNNEGKFCGFTWANGTYKEPWGHGMLEQANVLAAVSGLVAERPASAGKGNGNGNGGNGSGNGSGSGDGSGNNAAGGSGGGEGAGVRIGAGSALFAGVMGMWVVLLFCHSAM